MFATAGAGAFVAAEHASAEDIGYYTKHQWDFKYSGVEMQRERWHDTGMPTGYTRTTDRVNGMWPFSVMGEWSPAELWIRYTDPNGNTSTIATYGYPAPTNAWRSNSHPAWSPITSGKEIDYLYQNSPQRVSSNSTITQRCNPNNCGLSSYSASVSFNYKGWA